MRRCSQGRSRRSRSRLRDIHTCRLLFPFAQRYAGIPSAAPLGNQHWWHYLLEEAYCFLGTSLGYLKDLCEDVFGVDCIESFALCAEVVNKARRQIMKLLPEGAPCHLYRLYGCEAHDLHRLRPKRCYEEARLESSPWFLPRSLQA